MKYHYTCSETRCKIENLPDQFFDGEMELELALTSRNIKKSEDGRVDMQSSLIWVVSHGMMEDPEVKCPVCEGKSHRVIQKISAVYIRGNGYLDKKGCLRDMNLYKLQKDDPYGYMREPGEKDHLIGKLKAAGKHQTNPIRFYNKSKPKPKIKSD